MVQFRPVLTFIVSLLFGAWTANSQEVSWYKRLTGTIDKYPVTMHLHKAGHNYSGYYYYQSQNDPVPFNGEDSSEAGMIRLTAFIEDKVKENFTIKLAGTSATGKWHSANKSLSFLAKEDSSDLSFDYTYTSGSAPLRPNIKESPEATFEAAAVWPKDNTAVSRFVKKVINEEFGYKNSTNEVGGNLLNEKKQFFAEYRENNQEVADKDLKEAYSLFYENLTKMEVVYQTSKLLMLATYSYSFTGGAHPNHGTNYTPIDLVSRKKLSINDVVTKAGYARLSKLLEAAFRKQKGLKATDPLSEGGLFEDKIEPNENFYLTPKGIWFWYNPYEIGPYAMGDVNLFIPMSDLKDFLQPGFRKLIQ